MTLPEWKQYRNPMAWSRPDPMPVFTVSLEPRDSTHLSIDYRVQGTGTGPAKRKLEQPLSISHPRGQALGRTDRRRSSP
ncbi:MAG: hypothetical protein U0527_12800 [Candidatus Eisenbacteria bacterium]